MLRILKIATFDNLNGGSGSSDTANVENQPALISADDSSPDSHSDTFESKIKKIFNGVKQGLQEEAKKQSSVQKETETKKEISKQQKTKKTVLPKKQSLTTIDDVIEAKAIAKTTSKKTQETPPSNIFLNDNKTKQIPNEPIMTLKGAQLLNTSSYDPVLKSVTVVRQGIPDPAFLEAEAKALGISVQELQAQYKQNFFELDYTLLEDDRLLYSLLSDYNSLSTSLAEDKIRTANSGVVGGVQELGQIISETFNGRDVLSARIEDQQKLDDISDFILRPTQEKLDELKRKYNYTEFTGEQKRAITVCAENLFNGLYQDKDGNTIDEQYVKDILEQENLATRNEYFAIQQAQGIYTAGAQELNNRLGIGTTDNETTAYLGLQDNSVEYLLNAKTPEQFAAGFYALTGKELTQETLSDVVGGALLLDETSAKKAVEDLPESTEKAKQFIEIVAQYGFGTGGKILGAVGDAIPMIGNVVDAMTLDNEKAVGANLAEYMKTEFASDLSGVASGAIFNGADIDNRVWEGLSDTIPNPFKNIFTNFLTGQAEATLAGTINFGTQVTVDGIYTAVEGGTVEEFIDTMPSLDEYFANMGQNAMMAGSVKTLYALPAEFVSAVGYLNTLKNASRMSIEPMVGDYNGDTSQNPMNLQLFADKNIGADTDLSADTPEVKISSQDKLKEAGYSAKAFEGQKTEFTPEEEEILLTFIANNGEAAKGIPLQTILDLKANCLTDAAVINRAGDYTPEVQAKANDEGRKIWAKKMTESDSEGVFSQTISLLSENGLFANADLSIVSSAEQFKARSFLAQCKATGSKLFKALNESIKASKARITPTPKTKADTAELSRGFLANNNAQLQETIKNADFTQYAKNGIPLEYPRSAFLDDLNVQLANCDEAQAKNILNKLGITINDSKTGYDGFADYTKLDPNNPLEKPIYDITHKFLKENAVVTGDEQLDSALNSLITGFPELLNTVGKQQHAGQAYSVDIHTLKAYQNAISNPEFENLSNLDKTVVKYALLTHDLGKPEDVNDKLHQEVSAEITRTFLECLNLPPQTVDRVVNLVENHHWLEEYSTGTLDPLTASVDFRRADDFLLATIMAEADIGAISVRPNKTYLDSLNASQQPINDAIQQNNQTGTLIYTSTPIRAGEKQGYEVINLNEASEQEMTDFGFVPGTKREDVRFLVHMTSEKTGKTALDTIDELGDDAYLCASYISLDDKATFGMSSEGQRKFGVCLEVENANIGRANSIDQYSGHMQNYDGFVENVQKRSKNQALPKSIKTELSLTDDEYAQLYSQISDKQHLTQIRDEATYQVGDKILTGKEVRTAILHAQDSILSSEVHNEVNVYAPKINGVVAKVDSIEEVPQYVIDYAQEHDLPLYILGS